MTDQEREALAGLDHLTKVTRPDEHADDRRARRDYTNLDAEGVSLALRLDSLTGNPAVRRGGGSA